MATVSGTHKDRNAHVPDKRADGAARQPIEWKGIWVAMLVLLGIVALVAWLASILPAPPGGSGIQHWMMQ